MDSKTLIAIIATITLTLPALHAQYEGATPAPDRLSKGFGDISPEACRGWLEVLASDEFAGRKTGTKGHRLAADFMAARFEEFGLKPVGDDGTYFQNVELVRLAPTPAENWIGGDDDCRIEADGLVWGNYVGDVSAPVVLLRARGREAKLEDPSVLDGKIVLLNASRITRSPLYKQLLDASPTALVRYGSPPFPPSMAARRLQLASAMRSRVWARQGAFKKIVSSVGLDEELGTRTRENGVEVHPAKGTLTLHFTGEIERIDAPNVVGYLEGADENLKDELVICGSHLDHIGTSPNGAINNGADDDGSGSTALLAVARAFTQGVRPKRGLLFIAVCGEEDGLLGSEYYVEHPIFPLEKTVCELQMDMVGRNEEGERGTESADDNVRTTHLVGSKKLSMELHELALKANEHVGFEFEYDEERVWNRSDHYNFAKKGIPIVFVFSGFHRDYHRPTDTVDKINFDKIANTARLIYTLAHTVADRQERLVVDKGPFKTEQ